MSEPRLKTSIWVAALIRRAEIGGASAFVARKGEADAGAVIVKVSLLDGSAREPRNPKVRQIESSRYLKTKRNQTN